MEGADYNAWGNDDDYLGQFCISQLTGGKVTIVGCDSIHVAPATTDDTRSIHNEADISKIQTLQEQLDDQAKKLKTIMDLLYKSGSI